MDGLPSEDPAVTRAADLAAAGHHGDLTADAAQLAVIAARDDADGRVRAAAIGALVRAGDAAAARTAWSTGATDLDADVRRRTLDLGPLLAARDRASVADVAGAAVAALADGSALVVVAAAAALGELGEAAVQAGGVTTLAAVATDHADALAREAAVAALGALGDDGGLAAILTACGDKPAVRRRAVLALSPFDGPEVDAALRRALTDRDWQVRQAAEDLLETEA